MTNHHLLLLTTLLLLHLINLYFHLLLLPTLNSHSNLPLRTTNNPTHHPAPTNNINHPLKAPLKTHPNTLFANHPLPPTTPHLHKTPQTLHHPKPHRALQSSS